MEPEGSLPFSQGPANGPYFDAAECNVSHSKPVRLRSSFIIISPATCIQKFPDWPPGENCKWYHRLCGIYSNLCLMIEL
jgi:hypothetical protein